MYNTQTNTIRNVYNEEGAYLVVEPWCEAPGCVQLSAEGENKDYFGEVHVVLSHEFARELGKALIACADEVQYNEDQGDE